MPAHLIKRKDRGDIYYLVDGQKCESLKTKKKAIAEELLKRYIQGKYGLKPSLTVNEFYKSWIETKVEPLVRRSWIRDVSLHMNKYILPEFGEKRLTEVSVFALRAFQSKLITRGLGVKTVRNVIDSSFRTMWGDARQDISEIQDKDPFAVLVWPRLEREPPDPFTLEERDRILAYFVQNDFFYYPWVLTLFLTGMRPSEAAALKWPDVDLEAGTISIQKSVYLGRRAAGKTRHSLRLIKVEATVIEALKLLPSRALGLKEVFVNKFGDPLIAKKWAERYWSTVLDKLGIRHRKFYATRHTFITEMIKAGHNYAEVGDYCGTSGKMIEDDYRGPIELTSLKFDAPVLPPEATNYLKRLVAGPGFEPGTSRL
jgi:integrase